MAAKGERARRRAERERLAAQREAARVAAAERAARRAARKQAVLGWLPGGGINIGRSRGALHQRRRREVTALVIALIVVNLVIWFAFANPVLTVLAAMVTILVAPVVHTLLFR